MNKYLKITYPDGCFCVVDNAGDVESMTQGYEPGECSVEEVEMTAAEFEALPEFEG